MTLFENPQKLYLRERLTCRAEVEDRVFSFSVRVQDIDAKGLLVDVPNLGDSQLQPGQPVLVRYYRTDSAYQFITGVKGYEQPGTTPLMRIGFPGSITRYQRREHDRVEVGGTLQLLTPHGPTRSIRGYIKDISAGGMRVVIPRVEYLVKMDNPLGMRFEIRFTLDTGDSFDKIIASIRKLNQEPYSQSQMLMQLKFDEFRGGGQAELHKLIKQFE